MNFWTTPKDIRDEVYCKEVYYAGAVKKNLCKLVCTLLNVCLLCKSTQNSWSQKKSSGPRGGAVILKDDGKIWLARQCRFLDPIMWPMLYWKLHNFHRHVQISIIWGVLYVPLYRILSYNPCIWYYYTCHKYIITPDQDSEVNFSTTWLLWISIIWGVLYVELYRMLSYNPRIWC